MAAGVGQVGDISVEVLAALGAAVLGLQHNDIAESLCEGIPQVGGGGGS
jgi:hypothetical protein